MPTGVDPTLAVDLDLVIDQSQHGVLIFQRGRLTYANLRAAQMVGYQPGEIGKLTLGETLTIVHPADRARLMNALQTVLTGKFAPIQPEIRIRRNDGTYYWVDILVNPITYRNEPAILFNWIDISQRRQAEEALHRNVQRLQILHGVDHAILSAQEEETTARAALKHIRPLVPHYLASSVVLIDEQEALAHLLVLDTDQDLDESQIRQVYTLDELSVDLETLRGGRAFQIDDLRSLTELTPLQLQMAAIGIFSYLTVPLIYEFELIGMLNLASNAPAIFQTEHVEIAQEIADSLAVAIQQMRLRRADQQRRQEAEAMRDVMSALASAANINQALEVILVRLRDLIPYDRAGIFFLDENQHYLLAEKSPFPKAAVLRLHPSQDPLVEELKKGRGPIVVSDIQTDPRFETWPDMQPVRAWLGAPLLIGDDMVGFLSLGSLEPGTLDEADASTLQTFTSQVASILERAWQQEQSQRRSEELEVLSTISIAMDQTQGRENTLAALTQQVTRYLGASQGSFLALDAASSSLVMMFSTDAVLQGMRHPSGDDPLWQAIRSGQSMPVSEAQALLGGNPPAIYSALLSGAASAALIPLKFIDETLGILCLCYEQRREFTPEDLMLYQTTTQIAGTYLGRALELENLEKQVAVRTQQLSTLYDINRIGAQPLSLDEILEQVLAITLDALRSKVGMIHLVDASTGELHLNVQQGLPSACLLRLENLELNENFWRNLFSASNPLLVEHLRDDARLPFGSSLDCLKNTTAYMGTPISVKARPVGLFSILRETANDLSKDDLALFMAIADQIGFFIERERLMSQAEHAAVVDERQRLARELHDSVTQLLYSQVLFTSAGRKALQHGNLPLLEQHLGRISQGAQQALKEMRLLLYELRPSEYLQDGLVAALQRRLDAVENRTGMDVQFKVVGILPSLDEAQEVTLYRIAEEALNNTLKHSQAHLVSVEIHASGQQVELVVDDDGCGFDPSQKIGAGGIGLSSMLERATAVGGSVEIQSSPGEGTQIIARIGSAT